MNVLRGIADRIGGRIDRARASWHRDRAAMLASDCLRHQWRYRQAVAELESAEGWYARLKRQALQHSETDSNGTVWFRHSDGDFASVAVYAIRAARSEVSNAKDRLGDHIRCLGKETCALAAERLDRAARLSGDIGQVAVAARAAGE